MFIVGVSFGIRHRVVFQLLASFLQSWCFRVRIDDSVFEVINPFLQWRLGNLVEFIDAHQHIGWEYFGRRLSHDCIFLLGTDDELVLRMQADKIVLSYIDIVRPFAKVKIKYTNGIYLFYFFVGVAEIDMLGNGFVYAIKYTFLITQSGYILYLDKNVFTVTIFCLDFYSIELIFCQHVSFVF